MAVSLHLAPDPVFQDGNGNLQSQNQGEDNDEADDGPDEVLLRLFPGVLFIGLGDLHSQGDAVDGPHRHDDGDGGPENGVEYLQNRLDDRIEIDIGQNGHCLPPSAVNLFLSVTWVSH